MTAVVCVAGLGAALALAMLHAAWLANHYRRRARQAARQGAESAGLSMATLQPGPVVLHGRLETIGDGAGAGSPLSIAIEQTGSEEIRGGCLSHRWEETSRAVLARPFHLVLRDGSRVRVEPAADVVLRGPVEHVTSVGPGRRRCLAEIPAGREVHVRGQLQGGFDPAQAGTSGYRDPGHSLVLRAAPGQPVECSTAPLHARFAARADWYRSAAVLFAMLLGLTQLGIYGRFHLLSAFGQQISVADLEMTVRRPGRRSRHVDIAAQASFADARGAHALSDHVQFDEVPRPRRFSTFTVLPAWPALHAIGERPRISLHLFFWVLLLCGSLIGGHVRRVYREDRDLPWWQSGPRVDEGQGPLATSRRLDTERSCAA
jgi:hypothetical protein